MTTDLSAYVQYDILWSEDLPVINSNFHLYDIPS